MYPIATLLLLPSQVKTCHRACPESWDESAPGRASCALLFCWATGRKEGWVCRRKWRSGKSCFEYLFLVLPGHQAILAKEEVLPFFSTAGSRAAPQLTDHVFSRDVLENCLQFLFEGDLCSFLCVLATL